MPRRSSSPSLHERKITTMPIRVQDKNLPAIIPQRPSFLQTMKEGVAFGVGNAIAHRIVGSIMGPAIVQNPIIDKKQEEYEQCIKDNNDKSGCEHILRTN